MRIMSRFAISFIATAGLTGGITSAIYAVEIPKPVINIPKPNIPRPTINIPRQNVTVNVPKPAINVPRPNVTVNVPKPVVNVPKPTVTVNVPKPTVVVPKVDVPKPVAVTVPKADVPHHTVEVPKVEVPKPNIVVTEPKVNLPKAETPKSVGVVERPNANLPRPIVNDTAGVAPKSVGESTGPFLTTNPPRLTGGETPKATGGPVGTNYQLGKSVVGSNNPSAGSPNPITQEVRLPNGNFGKATVNANGTVTLSNNLGSVTLTPQQMKQVAAGDMSALGPLTGTSQSGKSWIPANPAGSTNTTVANPTVQGAPPGNSKAGLTTSSDGSVIAPAALKPMTTGPSSSGTTQGGVATASTTSPAAPSGYTYPVPPSGGCTDSSCKPGTYTLPPGTNAYCKDGCTAKYIGGGKFSDGSPLNAATSAGSTITTGYGTTTITNSVTGESQTFATPGTVPGVSANLTGAGTGSGQSINVSAGGVSANLNGSGGSSAPFTGTAAGQSVSSSTVNGVTTVTVAGQAIATCGYSTCSVNAVVPAAGKLGNAPSPKIWGFYQPGDPRPVTVFRLGEPIPSMPNVPDPDEVGPGNWYSYGYNPPPPPEPEDTPPADKSPPSNHTQQANNNTPPPNVSQQANNNTPAPNDTQQANNNGSDDGRCSPDPCFRSAFDNPDMTPEQMQAEVNQNRQKIRQEILQQAYGESLDDGRVEKSADLGMIFTAGGCFGHCAGLAVSIGTGSGLSLFSISPEQSVGYGNLSGVAFTNNAQGVAGGHSVYASAGGYGVSANDSGVAVSVTPAPGAAYTYSNQIFNLQP